MKVDFCIILSITTLTIAIPEKPCDRIKIEDQWYEREVLLSNLGRPHNLNIHKGTNTLFFSYTLPETYSDVDFQLAYYNLDSRDFQTIIGISGGCAVAIDENNDDIYLGGSNGIFKYNVLTKLADYYKEKFVNIWALFYRKNLFYISYPDQKLHIEIDGNFKIVREFIDIELDHFHVSTNNSIYFANKTGLYTLKNEVNYIESINNFIIVRQISEDNDGKVYICSNLGIFVNENELNKMLDMQNIYGLAFDRDNQFVISDEKSIIKLKTSVSGCMDNDEDRW